MKATLAKAFFMIALVIRGVSSMHAEEASYDEVQTVGEHVVVGSCPLSPERQALMESMRQEEMQQEQEAQDEESSFTELSGTTIPIKGHSLNTLITHRMNVTTASRSPYIFHWIEGFPQDNIVKLEDDSQWIFDATDIETIRLWHPGQTIVITPKGTSIWGSNYKYVLTNEDTNVSIAVNPCRGCLEFHENSTWIVGIDRNMSHIYFSNRITRDGKKETTTWEISSTDRELFEEWLVNQHIIFGPNESWFWKFSAYDHIIYNYHMNHYVHARKIK